MRRFSRSAKSVQQGASLIEVLVALLIISLGLISMARLSASTIGYNKGAQVRLIALSLAQQYADHAKLNVYGVDLGGYEIAFDEAAPHAPILDGDADDVTAATNVALADKQEFIDRVAQHLPQGRVVVSTTQATRDLDIWILWQDVNTESSEGLKPAAESQCPASVLGNSCLHVKVTL